MAKTTDALKAIAWEIAKQIRAIPIAADNTHMIKRQRLKAELFRALPADELPNVREYVRQFMTVLASRNRSWHQSNARLFVGNARTHKDTEVAE